MLRGACSKDQPCHTAQRRVELPCGGSGRCGRCATSSPARLPTRLPAPQRCQVQRRAQPGPLLPFQLWRRPHHRHLHRPARRVQRAAAAGGGGGVRVQAHAAGEAQALQWEGRCSRMQSRASSHPLGCCRVSASSPPCLTARCPPARPPARPAGPPGAGAAGRGLEPGHVGTHGLATTCNNRHQPRKPGGEACKVASVARRRTRCGAAPRRRRSCTSGHHSWLSWLVCCQVFCYRAGEAPQDRCSLHTRQRKTPNHGTQLPARVPAEGSSRHLPFDGRHHADRRAGLGGPPSQPLPPPPPPPSLHSAGALPPITLAHTLAAPRAGLLYDRNWVIVKEAGGRFLTQRQIPKCAWGVPPLRQRRPCFLNARTAVHATLLCRRQLH